jgi:hypothetical protein
MRVRTWIFAAVVAVVLAINLALVSLRVAQSGEDTVRERLAQASGALRAQLELVDARLAPRAAAEVPELAEATRSPADPAQPLVRPDDRALRAAASALAPEPDLLAVVNAQGAQVSRRAKPAQSIDDVNQVPLAKTALEGTPNSSFGTFDNVAYRLTAARVPGSGAAVIAGKAIDDRFATLLKSQVDADVTLVQAGKVLASSLSADDRARAQRWSASPEGPGFGVLQVRLPFIGNALSGQLPWPENNDFAVRAALVPLDAGVQAVLTVPASPYLRWLGRYQAFYLLGLVLFCLFGLLWGLFEPRPKAAPAPKAEPPAPRPQNVSAPRPLPKAAQPSLLGTDVGEARAVPEPPPGDVPWASNETPPEPSLVAEQPAPVAAPPPPPQESPAPAAAESLDPVAPPPPAEDEPAVVLGRVDPAPHPMWGPDPAQEPEKPAEAPKSDFSFAGLLDEAQRAKATAPADEEKHPSLAQDFPDATAPGGPSKELIEQSRSDAPPADASQDPFASFPGDEPTRVEPVSAALLDKLRERDDDAPAPVQTQPDSILSEPTAPNADSAWADALAAVAPAPPNELEHTTETPPPAMFESHEPAAQIAEAPEPEMPAPPPEPEADPDEQHWHETYERYVALKEELGEPGRPSYEKFAAKLAKNRADLLAKHNCRAVRFSVYEKDGKASIKAAAVR